MLKKIALTALFMIPALTYANDAAFIKKAKDAVSGEYIEPAEVKFKEVRMVTNLDGEKAVCGLVDGIDGYGNYEGYRSFYYQNKPVVIKEVDSTGADATNEFFYGYTKAGCSSKQIQQHLQRTESELDKLEKHKAERRMKIDNFCEALGNYYSDKITFNMKHEEAFAPVRELHSRLDMESTVGRINRLEYIFEKEEMRKLFSVQECKQAFIE